MLLSILVDYEVPFPCQELSTEHEEIFESEATSQNRTWQDDFFLILLYVKIFSEELGTFFIEHH